MSKVSETLAEPIQAGWKEGDPLEALLTREWLVTNALGGYASGTVGGACTRRFHGHLIAALRAPLGRTMMLNHLEEVIEGDRLCFRLSGDEHGGGKEIAYPEPGFLKEFVLECGLLAAAVAVYARKRPAARKAAWIFCGVLTLIQAAQNFGPWLLPTPAAVAVSALLSYLLFAFVASRIDRAT